MPSDQSNSRTISVKVTVETTGMPAVVLERKEVTLDQWAAIMDGLRNGIKAAIELPGPKGGD